MRAIPGPLAKKRATTAQSSFHYPYHGAMGNAREGPYLYYDAAVSICSTCLRRVDAKIVFQDGCVWMLKRCPRHGRERILIADDIDYYRRAREVFIKRPEQVQHPNTKTRYGCPYDCGICPDHEQHGCTLLIEITDCCNLRCPTCYANSGPERQTHRSLQQIESMLDLAVRNEGEPSIVQISGGEPTLHPDFFAVLDLARQRPIQHLMLNTNGVRIANEPAFAERLAGYMPEFEVYLQFDSLRPEALKLLRGVDLTATHQRALARLDALGIPTTLVCTVRREVNDDELGAITDFALTWPCVRGVTFQPVQAAGRLERYRDGYDPGRDRLTLTEVRRKLLKQTRLFAPEDIVPVPCHADNIAMGYAVRQGREAMALTGLVAPEILIQSATNTIAYEREAGLHRALFKLFSTHHSQASQHAALEQFLARAGADSSGLGYDNIFRVLIVEFIDAYAFDLRSIRKTCVHIVHPDGKRVIPFDTYNLFYRDGLETNVLAPIRAERETLKLSGSIATAR